MSSVSTDRRFGINSGMAVKVPAKAATTAAITLSGEQTVDGVSLVTGDRCLVKDQSSGIDNGVYTVDTGAWSRATDFDGSYDVVQGTTIVVAQGTVSSALIYRITTANPITIGTTSLAFDVFSASTLPFTQSGTGAVATDIQTKNRQILSVFDFMTVAQIADVQARTTLVNVATALQNAINQAFAVGGILYFPPGTYTCGATTLTFKNNVIYQGSGRDTTPSKGTIIQYSGTSDAIQINNPINSSTNAHYSIRDLTVQCGTRTTGKAAIADVGSTYVEFKNVAVSGNDVGVLLDQTELCVVDQCEFNVPNNATSIGLWLVNGADHTGGGSAYFTNQIKVRNCQFNGTSGIGIADDGGVSHDFDDNNFNALTTQVRITDAYGVRITGSEFELMGTTGIKIATTRSGGGAGGQSPAISIENNHFVSSAAISLITLDSASVKQLVVKSNNFNNNNGSGTPFSGLTAGATHYIGVGNNQQGSGSATGINSYDDSGTWTPADASGASLSLTIHDASWYRNGKMIEAYYSIVYPATGNGSGAAISGLPVTAANTNDSCQGGPPAYQSSGTYFSWLVGANGTTISAWGVAGGAVTNATLSGAVIRGNIRYVAA